MIVPLGIFEEPVGELATPKDVQIHTRLSSRVSIFICCLSCGTPSELAASALEMLYPIPSRKTSIEGRLSYGGGVPGRQKVLRTQRRWLAVFSLWLI